MAIHYEIVNYYHYLIKWLATPEKSVREFAGRIWNRTGVVRAEKTSGAHNPKGMISISFTNHEKAWILTTLKGFIWSFIKLLYIDERFQATIVSRVDYDVNFPYFLLSDFVLNYFILLLTI